MTGCFFRREYISPENVSKRGAANDLLSSS
jgi:hypothetical protein